MKRYSQISGVDIFIIASIIKNCADLMHFYINFILKIYSVSITIMLFVNIFRLSVAYWN